MTITGIIPARYASTRFPGKPLAMIRGKSMLQRVFEQASASSLLTELIVATDDDRIKEHAESFGARVILTKASHPSGTDRCYEAYVNAGCSSDYVLNIQGDEPFLDPAQIDSLLDVCDGKTQIATQMFACSDRDLLFSSGEVKIALNARMEALYFSRSVIPFIKNQPEEQWHETFRFYRHVGMYVYRSDVLAEISALKPSALEKAESLEQLRWLENGYTIRCVETEYESHCIDLPEDIEKVLRLMDI